MYAPLFFYTNFHFLIFGYRSNVLQGIVNCTRRVTVKSLWNAFRWVRIMHLPLRLLLFLLPSLPLSIWSWLISFFFLVSYPNLISIPWILCLCLSTKITLTIQIINCFSLVFVLWFSHSCSLPSLAFLFSLKRVSCVRVRKQNSWQTKKSNKETRSNKIGVKDKTNPQNAFSLLVN